VALPALELAGRFLGCGIDLVVDIHADLYVDVPVIQVTALSRGS